MVSLTIWPGLHDAPTAYGISKNSWSTGEEVSARACPVDSLANHVSACRTRYLTAPSALRPAQQAIRAVSGVPSPLSPSSLSAPSPTLPSLFSSLPNSSALMSPSSRRHRHRVPRRVNTRRIRQPQSQPAERRDELEWSRARTRKYH